MFSEKAYQNAAKKIGCEIAAIKAVAQVESSGSAFNKDGLVKILFEAHHFFKHLKALKIDTKKVDQTICQPVWNQACRDQYKKDQYLRLSKAIRVHEESAYRSISMGAFQIMGSHFKMLGYQSAKEMYARYQNDADIMLDDFCDFVINSNLAKHLISKNWAAFAKGYNGASYAVNKYDIKMAQAYFKFKNS